MKKQTKMILLIGWIILSAVMYFAAVRLEFEPITHIYAAMSLVFGIGFVLVNGGVRSTVKTASREDDKKEQLSKKQTARMRYHKEPEKVVADEPQSPRMNIFRLSPQKQKFFAELLLILFLAPTVILALDYILIAFIPDYI